MNDRIHQVEKEVRETVESGVDIYERVRAITLKALTEHTLDTDNIKKVTEAVLKGVGDGIGDHYDPARKAFDQSIGALDDALTKTAEASKLAIEEAASNMSEFTRNDLNRAADDLKSLESLFLETVEKAGRTGNETVAGIVRDFISHARKNGTEVGKQSRVFLENLDKIRVSGQHGLIEGAAETTSALAKIAGGFLSGIAASLNPEKPRK
ncbi:MAG: DUF6781 family protein [Gammaproteobacteria bacterium]